VNIGDLVYSGHMMEIGHTVLGIVVGIDRCTDNRTLGLAADDQGEETIFRIFWVDNDEPAWYYSNEVERVDATRRPD
jgi:hypothetical protein